MLKVLGETVGRVDKRVLNDKIPGGSKMIAGAMLYLDGAGYVSKEREFIEIGGKRVYHLFYRITPKGRAYLAGKR